MTLSKEAAAKLLAEIDAEFGKKTKGKKELSHNDQVRLLNKEYNQRNSTGTFSDVAAEANAVSRSWKNQPGWKPIKRVTYIVHECCRNCPSHVRYVGNQFVKFENRRLKAQVNSAELITHDEFGFELPHELEEHWHDVEYCADCLILSKRYDDLLAIREVNGFPAQLSLPVSAGNSIDLNPSIQET